MRRFFTAFMLATAAIAGLAACSDNKVQEPPLGGGGQPGTSAGAPAPAGSAAPSALPGIPGGSDVKTVCAGYNKVAGEAGNKFNQLMLKIPEAMADPAKAGPVLTELKGLLNDYRSGLTTEAARSADGALRTAIEADAAVIAKTLAGVESAGTDIQKVIAAVNTPEFQQLGEKVRTLCEK